MARRVILARDDEWVQVFFKAPRSFRDALHKAAAMRGMSLSSFIRSVLIESGKVDWEPPEPIDVGGGGDRAQR